MSRARLLEVYLEAIKTKHIRCLTVLETMWGTPGKADDLFPISPQNFTGRRLYWLLGHDELLVTNSCKERVGSAKEHGVPDPVWLAKNLQLVTYNLLLVCGKVAQQTYNECGYAPECRVLHVPHPAARGYWTRANLDSVQSLIQSGIH